MEVDEVLAQFGCMQTQDKEELVNQMLRLVGTNINYTTARFYLEMNQWNVQAAVCSYFDLETVNSSLPGWCGGAVRLRDMTLYSYFVSIKDFSRKNKRGLADILPLMRGKFHGERKPY